MHFSCKRIVFCLRRPLKSVGYLQFVKCCNVRHCVEVLGILTTEIIKIRMAFNTKAYLINVYQHQKVIDKIYENYDHLAINMLLWPEKKYIIEEKANSGVPYPKNL